MADFSINAELKANASQFVTEFKKGEAGVNSLGSVVEKILGPKGKLIMALSVATTAAMKFGQSMNASMSEIAKGTGATGEELYKLRQNVHSALINGVGRSAKEVGTMIADLNTRFGVTGEELTTLTGEFDKFANVTDTDTKTAINLVADAMAKWDIEVEDTDKLLDQLTKASQLSGAGVTELTNGLKEGQAIFSQFGMSATDTIAFMASLKQNGIESSQALIAMKTALANFANAGIDAQEGFAQVSEAIKNATSQTEALSIATSTFGARNGAEMVKVLQSGAVSADEFKEKLMLAGGTVEDTEKASRTSKDAIEDFISVIKGSFGGLVEGIDTLFRGLFDVLAEIFQTLSPIIEPVMNIVRDILSFIGDLGASLAEMLTDVVENTLGFAQLTTALEDFHETIHNILANVLETFKTAFSLIFNIITGQWELAWLDCQKIVLTLGQSILDTISDLINAFKDQINVLIEKVLNPLIDKINWVQKKLKQPVTEKLQPFKDLDLSKLTGLEDALEKVNKKIQDASGKSTRKVTGDLGKIQKATKKTATQAQKEEQETTETEDKEAQKRRDIAKSTAKMKNDLINGVSQTYGSMFTMLGQEMVKGEAGWEDYAAVAVQGVAQVLQSLGSELLALSAVRAAHYDYGTAAVAATAATAAFVASGVLTAVSSAMKSSAEETKNASAEISDYGEAIESLEETLQDLIEGSTSVNGFTKAVTAMDNMIEAATANIKKAQAQLESFNGETAETTRLLREYFGNKAKNWSDSEVWDYAIGHMKNVNLVVAYAIIQQDKLNKKINQTKKELEDAQKIAKEAFINALFSLRSQNEELQQQIDLYKEIYNVNNKKYYSLQLEEQLVNVKNQLASILAEFTTLGSTIGDTVMEGLEEGLSKEGFLSNMKKIIKNNLLKIAVYTESFQSKLADIGAKLASALSGEKSLKSIREELEELWDTASKSAEKAEKIINESFSDIADDIDDATEEITDALTTFEDAMQSFADSIKDTGASIANEIVNGLTNGLSQSDFLSKMQTWLRNNLIQMVVYTDSMKSEIQAISDKIAEIMGSGRMFTTDELHEIRRDLSYAYESATTRMGTIDEILSSVFSGYAIGTQNATAGLHLVGEAGPELVRFRGGEQVFNANETRDILSGGNMGNNFNVTFVNTQDTTAMAMMNQLRQYNRELAINGIL